MSIIKPGINFILSLHFDFRNFFLIPIKPIKSSLHALTALRILFLNRTFYFGWVVQI